MSYDKNYRGRGCSRRGRGDRDGSGGQEFCRTNTGYYCWMYGNGSHMRSICTNCADSHKENVTFSNMQGGSQAGCTWHGGSNGNINYKLKHILPKPINFPHSSTHRYISLSTCTNTLKKLATSKIPPPNLPSPPTHNTKHNMV